MTQTDALASQQPSVLPRIFVFLSTSDLLRVALVNKTWQNASQVDALWEKKLRNLLYALYPERVFVPLSEPSISREMVPLGNAENRPQMPEHSFKQAYVRYQRAQWEMYNEVSFEHDQDKMVSMERVTFFWNLIRLGLVMSCIVGLPTWLLLWRGLYWVHLLPFLVSLAILSATLMMATCFTRISPLFRTFGKEVQYLWLPLFSTIGVFVSILLYVLHISGRVPIFNLAAITSPVMISFTIHAIVCFFMLFSDKKDFVQTLSTGMSSVVPLCVTLFCAIMSVEQYIPNSRIVFAFVPLIFCYICIIILCLYAVCNYELTNRLNFVVIMLMIMVTCLIGTHLLFSLDVTTYVSWIFFVIPYVIFYVIIIQSTFVTE